MHTVIGCILTLLVALIPAMIACWFIMKNIWIAVLVNGVMWGCTLGVFTYAFMLAVASWQSFIGFLTLAAIGAFIGGCFSCKYGNEMMIDGTAFFGSYLCMRGWTIIFGGYPGEVEMYEKLKVGAEV